MNKNKIVIIGGGSLLWSPGIIWRTVQQDSLSKSTITLMDTDKESLDLMVNLGKRIVSYGGNKVSLEGTTNRRKALKNANFVVLSISTGGLEAMSHDLEIPLKYGIHQSVGDTVGPGGISRILRNVPVAVEIARDIEELCPDAWLLNYSNPMAPFCRAINLKTKVKVAGMCPGLYGQLKRFRKLFNLNSDSEIGVRVGGINHFYWILNMRIRGEDGFRLLREKIESGVVALGPVQRRLFELFGCIPGPADRHIMEFLPYFLKDEVTRKRYSVWETTIKYRMKSKDQLKNDIMEIIEERKPLSEVPNRSREMEMSADIISALIENKHEVFVLNLPNNGQISNLPKEHIVETLATVGSDGINPLTVGELPPAIHTLVHTSSIEHELAVQSAIKGDRDLAAKAMALDPLVQDVDIIGSMLDDLLEANKQYLPQFH